MKRLNYRFNYKISNSGVKFLFGELDGIVFNFPVALGRSCAVQRIITATGCTTQDAEDAYDAFLSGEDLWPVVQFNAYKDYLNDKSWNARRSKSLKRGNYLCSRCGSTRDLNVHHLTYARIGQEEQDDLIVLCRRCHSIVHGLTPKV